MTVFLSHLGHWGLAAMYGMEAIGLPLPIEIPLWLSGQWIHTGTAIYWEMVFFTWLGSSAGNLTAFLIARLGGRPLLEALAHRLRMQAQVQRMQGWIDRYGLWAVVFCRWINWGYALSLWLTGFARLPASQTLSVVLLNTAIWSMAWVALGRTLVGALHIAGLPGWFMLVPGAVMLVIMSLWRLWPKKRMTEGEA
ncbi:MAG: DedA family protein [Mycobacterium leprae]